MYFQNLLCCFELIMMCCEELKIRSKIHILQLLKWIFRIFVLLIRATYDVLWKTEDSQQNTYIPTFEIQSLQTELLTMCTKCTWIFCGIVLFISNIYLSEEYVDFSYHNHKNLTDYLRAVSQNYNSITSLYSIGKSVEGNSIFTLEQIPVFIKVLNSF